MLSSLSIIILFGLLEAGFFFTIYSVIKNRKKRLLFKQRYVTVKKTSRKLKSFLEREIELADYDTIKLTYKTTFASRNAAKQTGWGSVLDDVIKSNYEEIINAMITLKRNRESNQQNIARIQPSLEATPYHIIAETGIEAAEYIRIEDVLYEKIIKRREPGLILTIKKVYTDNEQKSRAIVKHYKDSKLTEPLYKETLRRVQYYSEKIPKLEALNSAYINMFANIEHRDDKKACKSINEYKKYAFSDLFIRELIQAHKEEFAEEIEKINANKKYYGQYREMVSEIAPSSSQSITASRVPEAIFLYAERKTVEAKMLPPPETSFRCHIRIRYITPKRGKEYLEERTYSDYEISRMLEEQQRAALSKSTQNEERKKMTDSLRYDIMKRDNFRCCLCGAGVEDGVKLHVDHIVPVSKGGKTIKSNLRTLCDRCNMGKRDKFDPNGPN